MQEYCTLEPISRKLTLTEPQRIAGVESDENVRGLKFKFPKIVEGTDFTQMQLRINFINSRQEKGQHIVTDLKPLEGEEGYITFTWPFSRLVTHYRGYTKFVICAVKTDENGTITAEWNTALAQMRVLEGLEVDEPDVTPEENDVIAQLISICQNSADKAAQSAQQAQEEAEKVLTYGPQIGANGNWIVGGEDTGQPSQGFSPTVQTKPIDNGTEVVIIDKNGEKSFEVKDGKDGKDGQDGAPGTPGKNGADGKTPVRGTDYWTNADKKEIVDDVIESVPIANDTTQGIVKAKPVLAQGELNPVSILPDGTLLHETTKPGELLLAEYIHQGNQEIYFSSFDWSTGIGECTEPHGITKELTKIIIVPNNWWSENINNDIGLSIPFEWCLYEKPVRISVVDENHLKVVGQDSIAIQVNPDDPLNSKIDCTRFHFEIGIPFEISNFPVKPTMIRMTMSGFFRNEYRYISPCVVMQNGSSEYINNMLLDVPKFGVISKPDNALYQEFSMTFELDGSWYAIFKFDNIISGRRASGTYNYVFGESTREQKVNIYRPVDLLIKKGMYQYISALRTYGNIPSYANYSNHTVVRIYAKAVMEE